MNGITQGNRLGEANFVDGTNQEFNQDFTLEGVASIVNKSKSGIAPGIDGLLSETLKNDASIRLLTVLFNTCLRNGILPSVWSKEIINPIPKSRNNNPRLPPNYHGISLLPVTSKLYTAVISNRLSKYQEKNNLLANVQNGFREKRSCLDHIYTLNNVCRIRKNLRQEIFLCFIDFQKAFGFVPHEMLYHKLLSLKVDGDIYMSIRKIYDNPISCVQLNGQ